MKISDFHKESSWTLKMEQLLGGTLSKNKDFYLFITLVCFELCSCYILILFLVFMLVFVHVFQGIEAESY